MSDARSTVHGRVLAILGVAAMATLVSGHIGSPDVFFAGKAGAYDVRVTVRPPTVVPGIAHVTVRTGADVQRVSIRPVFWRAGSKGSPSADATTPARGASGTYEGSLWLMARGAYSVDVIVEGAQGKANVLVPVASVATGTLAMGPALGAILLVFGLVLCAGLVTIVYKAAGESLVDASETLEPARRSKARLAAAISLPVIALLLFGGARWWNAVDSDYDGNIYRPPPLDLTLNGSTLELRAREPLFAGGGRISRYMPDHGKTMHLFLVKADDARGFAHLHPAPLDTSANPILVTQLPPLPAGKYNVFGDVVHENGFERTLVGSLDLGTPCRLSPTACRPPDADDAWYEGDASVSPRTTLADGSVMMIDLLGAAAGGVRAGDELSIAVTVADPAGTPAQLEPYLGMPAHGVVARLDGQVYVHLHPMGTVTMAAQEAFATRDRGDTTASGRLVLRDHSGHVTTADPTRPFVEFPYAFPSGGTYRLFVQVKRAGRILTGAFAVPVRAADEAR